MQPWRAFPGHSRSLPLLGRSRLLKKKEEVVIAASPLLLLSCWRSSSEEADSRLTLLLLLSSSWAWICWSLCSASSLPASASRASAQLCSSSCCCHFSLASSAAEDATVSLVWTLQVNRRHFYKWNGVSCKDAHTALSGESETYRWALGFFWAPARACLSPRTPIWALPGGLGHWRVTGRQVGKETCIECGKWGKGGGEIKTTTIFSARSIFKDGSVRLDTLLNTNPILVPQIKQLLQLDSMNAHGTSIPKSKPSMPLLACGAINSSAELHREFPVFSSLYVTKLCCSCPVMVKKKKPSQVFLIEANHSLYLRTRTCFREINHTSKSASLGYFLLAVKQTHQRKHLVCSVELCYQTAAPRS